jgi:hypothetical protein
MAAPRPHVKQPELNFRLHHRQGLALNSRATEVLFGGAAGGGKSYLMRVAAILWCLMIPGLQVYLFRRTVKDLIKNHMEGPTGFPVLLAALIHSRYVRIVKNEIRFANGSKIFLNHCEHEADADSYRGYEFHVLIVDELTTFTERQYRMLQSRVRMPDEFKALIREDLRGLFPRILCSSNPGGPGHHFAKKHWVDHGPMVIHNTPPDGADVLEDAIGGEPLIVRPRQFIPSLLSDNPSLNRREYAATLAGLNDPLMVRAMLDGDWTIIAGAMFERWRPSIHVCPSFDIPADWPLWRGADDGYANAHCTLWGTRDPNTGTVFVIDELYGTKMLADEVIQRVKETDFRIPITDGESFALNVRPLTGIMDLSAWNDTGLGTVKGTRTEKNSRGDAFTAGGLNFHRSRKGPRCRQLDAQNIQRMLAKNPRDPDGNPSLMVFSKCLNLIRTMPAIMRDLKDPEDWADGQDDHALDALRNLLQWKDGGFKLQRVG